MLTQIGAARKRLRSVLLLWLPSSCENVYFATGEHRYAFWLTCSLTETFEKHGWNMQIAYLFVLYIYIYFYARFLILAF